MCHLYAWHRACNVKESYEKKNKCFHWDLYGSEILGRGWRTSSLLCFFCIIHVWLCFPESTISSLNWEELPRNWVPFASWWSTIDQVFLFMFSLCLCDLLGSFKENDNVVLAKELGPYEVFENNQAGFYNLKGKSSLSLLISDPLFSNQIRRGSCICFQLWLNGNYHATSVHMSHFKN